MAPNQLHDAVIVDAPRLRRPQEVLKRYEPDLKDILDFVSAVRERVPRDGGPGKAPQAAALGRLADFVRNMEALMGTLKGRGAAGTGLAVNAEHLEAHIRANILPLKQQIDAMRKALAAATSAKKLAVQPAQALLPPVAGRSTTPPVRSSAPEAQPSPTSVAGVFAAPPANVAPGTAVGETEGEAAGSRRSKRIRLAKKCKYGKQDPGEDGGAAAPGRRTPTPPPTLATAAAHAIHAGGVPRLSLDARLGPEGAARTATVLAGVAAGPAVGVPSQGAVVAESVRGRKRPHRDAKAPEAAPAAGTAAAAGGARARMSATGASKAAPRARSGRGSRSSKGAQKVNSAHFAELVRAPVPGKFSCTACSVSYRGPSTFNPWWNIQTQTCPSCAASQVPRIDILDPDNDYNRIARDREAALARRGTPGEPAATLLDTTTPAPTPSGATAKAKAAVAAAPAPAVPSSAEVVSLARGSLGATGVLRRKLATAATAAPGADATCVPCEVDESEAPRLLVLMRHARLCGGQHATAGTRHVCNSVKFLMLHLRDCPGTAAAGEPCPFPWCSQGTQLLRHVQHCRGAATCSICQPTDLPKALLELQYLNVLTEESVTGRPEDSDESDVQDLGLDSLRFFDAEEEDAGVEGGDDEDDGLYVGAEEVEDLAHFPELQDFLFELA